MPDTQLIEDLSALKVKVDDIANLRTEVALLRNDVKRLTAAFDAASGVVSFFKTVAALGAAFATAWLAITTLYGRH